MNYIELHNGWEERQDQGQIVPAMKLLREEIATNLAIIHNKYSDIKYPNASFVAGFLTFAKVRPEAVECFIPFQLLHFHLHELDIGLEDDSMRTDTTDEEYLGEYIKLKEELREEMALIDDDGKVVEEFLALHQMYEKELEAIDHTECPSEDWEVIRDPVIASRMATARKSSPQGGER